VTSASMVTGLIVLIVLFALILRAYSFLSQGDYRQEVNSQLPPDGQGLYESCAPQDGSRCLDRLKQMAAGGFTLVLNYDQLNGTAEQQLAYAKRAYSLGMRVIWAMSDPAFWNGTDLISHYSDLAATCNCSDNNGFIRYFVRLVKDLPATWGYYVGDEVAPGNHAKLKMVTDLVKQTDPHHPRLFVSCSQCDHDANLSYVASLIPMVDTTDVVGTDWYPVGSGADSVTDTGKVASAVQSVADQYGKRSAMVLQSFTWSEYPSSYHSCSPYPSCVPYPTEAQMRQMRDLTLQSSHPRLILWYSYFDILKSDNPTSHWTDLVAAASAKMSGGSKGTIYKICRSVVYIEGGKTIIDSGHRQAQQAIRAIVRQQLILLAKPQAMCARGSDSNGTPS